MYLICETLLDFDQIFRRVVNSGIFVGKVLKAYLRYIIGRKYCCVTVQFYLSQDPE